MSKFCYNHSARVGKKSDENIDSSVEDVVAFIVNKKQTRNETYYQVVFAV